MSSASSYDFYGYQPLTFKIHLSVSIEVNISQDLVDLAVVELLPHQLLHGFPQLSEADLTVTIRVKLQGKEQNELL